MEKGVQDGINNQNSPKMKSTMKLYGRVNWYVPVFAEYDVKNYRLLKMAVERVDQLVEGVSQATEDNPQTIIMVDRSNELFNRGDITNGDLLVISGVPNKMEITSSRKVNVLMAVDYRHISPKNISEF